MKAYLADRAAALQPRLDRSPPAPRTTTLDREHWQVEHHAMFDGWCLIRYGPDEPHGGLVARLEDEAEGRRIAAVMNRAANLVRP